MSNDREARRRQRELERAVKEAARLSELERAALEVDVFENKLTVLQSLHKDQSEQVDWVATASVLPPVPPRRRGYEEAKARLKLLAGTSDPEAAAIVEGAQSADDSAHAKQIEAHALELADWQRKNTLAHRILHQDTKAYVDAMEMFNPFTELDTLGASLEYVVHSARLVEVVLRTNGQRAIPAEMKSLTSTGRVSTKAMPKARFVEIYQDHVCSCVLRVAREFLAILPVHTLLITAEVDALDSASGRTASRAFLSVQITRTTMESLNFDLLDPSDTILAMPHRGDLRTSRKSGEFEFIVPLTEADLPKQSDTVGTPLGPLIAEAERLRGVLADQCVKLGPQMA